MSAPAASPVLEAVHPAHREIVAEALRSIGGAGEQVIDLNRVRRARSLPPVRLSGTIRLYSDTRYATIDTESLYICVAETDGPTGEFEYRYRICGPTQEQYRGLFDARRHLPGRLAFMWGKGRGARRPYQLIPIRTPIRHAPANPHDAYLIHYRDEEGRDRWLWDPSLQTNLERDLFNPIVAALRTHGLLPPEVIEAMDGQQSRTGAAAAPERDSAFGLAAAGIVTEEDVTTTL
jgi:hypothetical protein